MSSGAGAGNAVPGWLSMRGSSTSMTGRSHPSSRSASPAVVTAAIGAASSTMNPIRAAGSAGSIGRYAAPVFSTAKIATIASADRENSSATHCPGPAPCPASRCANRFAPPPVRGRSSSGPRRSPPPPPGCGPPARRTTPESTPPAVTGWVNTARLPISSSRACSPSSSTSTDDNRRLGSAVIATNTRSEPLDQRLDAGRVEHVGAKLHRPGNPGGLTGLGPAFGQGKHQIHAGGVGVRRQRGDLHITQRQPGGGVVVVVSGKVLPGQHHLDQRVMGQAIGSG